MTMNKLHIIVAALAGMIAVTSCEVDTSEWNSTPWSLESYSIGLRCLSAEFPAVKMSEMLDLEQNPCSDRESIRRKWFLSNMAEIPKLNW